MNRIMLVLVVLFSIGCGPTLRAAECQDALGVEGAFDTVVNVIVSDVTSGILPAAVVPLVASAVSQLEGWINSRINHALCAPAATPQAPSPGARLRAAIIARPVPHAAP